MTVASTERREGTHEGRRLADAAAKPGQGRGASGRVAGPRPVRPSELPSLLRLLDGIFRAGGGSMAREHGYMYGRANAPRLRVIVRRGEVVSHFGFMVWDISLLGADLRMASVGGVGTREERRGAGYATRLLRDAEAAMRDEGVDLVLVSGGRGLYRRNGYAPAVRCETFALRRPPGPPLRRAGVAVRAFRPRDAATLARLCAAEPARYRRSREQMAQLMAGRLARPIPDRYYLVSVAGQDVAWFDVSTSPDGRSRQLWEYAGDRAAVLAGASAVMRRERWELLRATVPAGDALAARLRAAGCAQTPDSLPEHTFKVFDFGAFMDKLRPVWRERAGADCADALRFARAGSGGAIRDGRRVLRLADSAAVAAFLFGDHGPAAAAARRTGGRIAGFAQAALPLPFMLPGMNYV